MTTSSATSRGKDRGLSALQIVPIAIAGVALWVFACAIVVASTPVDERATRIVLATLIIGVPMAAGLYAVSGGGTARFGYILMGIGAVWSLSVLGESPSSLPYTIGRVSAWLIFPLLIYAMLAFPDGRVAGRIDRRLCAGVTLLIAALYIGSAPFTEAFPEYTPWASCRVDCPPNAFFIVDSEPAWMGAVVEPLRELLGVVLLFGVTGSLAHRWHHATRLGRRTLAPVVVISLLSSALLAAFLLARRAGADPSAVETLGALWSLMVPGAAAAFALGMMRHHLLLGNVLARISGAVAHVSGREGLRDMLAGALDDPDLELRFPDPAPGHWRDSRGEPVTPPGLNGDPRGVTRISDDGRPLAAIVHDAELSRDEELMQAVAAQVLVPLRHERLTGRLALSLAQLDESRKRIVAVADLERSRIERNLHDGAQQRLVLLRIKLTLAEELVRSDPQAGADAMAKLGDEIDAALEDLRTLAHGVYPAVLSDRGLEDALRSVVMQSPMSVRLDARGLTRQAPEIEAAVYFTCVEALQNASKHATGASRVWITIGQDKALRFEVGDDGPGFDPHDEPGGGLRNMRDRVEAVGGRLAIDSAPGRGTRVRGVVPLG